MRLLLLILSAALLLAGCSFSGEEISDPIFVPLSSHSSASVQAEEEPVSGQADRAVDTPYGVTPLEELPASYPDEQREKDGVVSEVHGVVQYNGDKITEFLQKVENGNPAMLRVSYVTIEGDPIFTDIEYHPESQSFRRLCDNSRDRFGVFEGITGQWYPYLEVLVVESEAETGGTTGLYLCEGEDGDTENRIAVCSIPAENREDCLQIWNNLKEKYSGDKIGQ